MNMTVEQARAAGADAGARDAEELFRDTDALERARIDRAEWGYSASDAVLVTGVPAHLRRIFEEAYERAAALVWDDLLAFSEAADAEDD